MRNGRATGGAQASECHEATSDPVSFADLEASERKSAHAIVLDHLREIKTDQKMYTSIETDDYWKDVFRRAGHPQLYDEARPEIIRALEAGLAPYYRGEPVSAVQFADLAIRALDGQITVVKP